MIKRAFYPSPIRSDIRTRFRLVVERADQRFAAECAKWVEEQPQDRPFTEECHCGRELNHRGRHKGRMPMTIKAYRKRDE